jgi:ESS family glutamate:Na+ symporter
MLPVFSCAFIVGLLVKWFYDKTKFSEYLSPATIHHLSGAFTDYLVAFGVASIKISVVAEIRSSTIDSFGGRTGVDN